METQSITIFVHGTLPPDAVMSIPPVRSFFFCPPGLTKASDLDPTLHTQKLAQLLCATEGTKFQLPHFYCFGWSGKLNPDARKTASQELYIAIKNLIVEYEKQGIKARITLITHSHGGNVVLLIQESAVKEGLPHGILPYGILPIEELILLACPVQTETAGSAQTPFFNKIYSIHSHGDLFQVLDPQGVHTFLDSLKQHGLEFTLKHLEDLGPLFSSRHFEAAEHIIQLNVRYPRRELLHIEFLLPSFIASLPKLILQMQEQIGGHDGREITLILKN